MTKHRYTLGARGVRAPYNPRTVNLGLELLCNACAFGAFLLNSDYRIVFANREGADFLSRWTSYEGKLAKMPQSQVPPEIRAACERLRRGDSVGTKPGRPLFGGRIFVQNPARENLSAVVALERSPRDRRLALFCVFLHDRLKESVASGRRDQLTMLTVAERRVAKLVVDGLRNREIAIALGKSVTTVKSQLATIFGKLQVTSRVQLATRLRSA